MAHLERDINDSIKVTHKSREFTFKEQDAESVVLTFVKTNFRKASIVTDEYETVSDIPDAVLSCLDDHEYEVKSVSPPNLSMERQYEESGEFER